MANIPGLSFGSGQAPQGLTLGSFGGNNLNTFDYNKAFQSGGLTPNYVPSGAPRPPTPGGQVLGASTGGGGGGNQNPYTTYVDVPGHGNMKLADAQRDWGYGQNPQPPDMSVFDKIIDPVIQNFESLIGTQQQTSANTIAGLGKQRETELGTQQAQFSGQEQELNRQGTSQTTEANNAIEEAKRMYSEMSQGTLARYGATTGTGAFLNEQLGQSTGRNITMLHQSLQQHLQDVNDKIGQVKQMGELAIRGTNERFDQAIQTEQDNLQKFIGQIKGNEAMLQSNKAQMAAQAIQHYQDTVNNLNAQRAQQQQAWATAQLNAETQLKIYGQKGQQALQQVQQTAPNYSNMATNGLNINQAVNSGGLTVTPGQQQDTGTQAGLAQPQQNAFQAATGTNNRLQSLA